VTGVALTPCSAICHIKAFPRIVRSSRDGRRPSASTPMSPTSSSPMAAARALDRAFAAA